MTKHTAKNTSVSTDPVPSEGDRNTDINTKANSNITEKHYLIIYRNLREAAWFLHRAAEMAAFQFCILQA